MKKILLIGLIALFLIGCTPKESLRIPVDNQSFYIGNLSLLTQPTGVIFNADYITFTDGVLNITFNQTSMIDFYDYDYIEWNIANETFRYERVSLNQSEQKK